MRIGSTALLIALGPLVGAQEALDGASAARWEPRTGWTQTPPTRYSVANEDGALVFRAEGSGTELPWQLTLRPEEVNGEARYLLIRYRADGLANPPGNYLLHGWEGTPGGLTYAYSDEVVADGQPQTLATDLLRLWPAGDTTQLGIKVIVGEVGAARLTVERLWFADELPPEARVSRTGAREARSSVLDWRTVQPLRPEPGWTQRPATDSTAALEGTAVTFSVRGAGKQMRWPLTLPEPVDLAALPFFSVRYRASGTLGRITYAVWLGDDPGGQGQNAFIPLQAGDLVVDGRWHMYTQQLNQRFTATQLAVGLDSDGDEATMTLDSITFSSAPARWPIAQLLPHEARDQAWPAGQGRFTVLPPAIGPRPSPFLGQRLGLADWFATREISVGGVPFAVPTSPEETAQTGAAARGELSLPLPGGASEVYLLTAAAAPPTEPWGIDWQHPRLVERLTVPEKVVCEVRYAEGAPDFVLPLDATTGEWGLQRGLGVHVVHPDPTRRATELLLHDRMGNAAFAILGATVLDGPPRVAEPSFEALAYPDPPKPALIDRRLDAALEGPTWSRGAAGSEPSDVAWAESPLFEVEIAGETLPAEGWQPAQPRSVISAPGEQRLFFRNEEAGLRAEVALNPSREGRLTLRMSLANEGLQPVTATLRFPVLRGVRLGSVEDTWYLFGKRGGLINREPTSLREPLGEPHPLQVDGFFNPQTGVALACLTHDTKAQHHFIRSGKDADGGSWSPEYVERDLAPGATFEATEAELVLCEGDWRAIFAEYRRWLSTWFRPPSPKPWWERTFAFLGCNAHYDMSPDPKVRGAIQPRIDAALTHLGLCDYVHLFGWSSTKTYGDWGDYDHYDETVGGLEYFRGNIAAAQAAGVAVGLYQDGYLSSEAGQSVGAKANEWAMRRPDGSPNFVPEYQAYNQCPHNAEWRKYLAATYARIEAETGAKGLYIDEYGATDGRWTCYAKDHGHNGYEVPYAGEVATLQAIRDSVGPEVALYTEYPSAEVSRQILDGSFTYQALWSAEQEPLAPHFIDLPRFAFPHFKQFHIIYYVTPRDGNWWLLKFPFFNGESYDIGEPGLAAWDGAALAFQRRAVEVLCAHREAFASHDVEPLVRTEVPGVFANEFRADSETVWTLYNANGRSVRGPLLRMKHSPGAAYEDAWRSEPIEPVIEGDAALLGVELGPKAIGCLVQRTAPP